MRLVATYVACAGLLSEALVPSTSLRRLTVSHRAQRGARLRAATRPAAISEDERGLLATYDPENIAEFFRRNPALLATRTFDVVSNTVRVVGGLVVDLALAGFPRPPSEAWESVMERRGADIRDLLETAGPTFVKFGQALASRSDLIGVALANELLLLQDRLGYFDDAVANEILSSELPRDSLAAKDLLGSLSPRPLAAASLSQVYQATVDGQTVAVKVCARLVLVLLRPASLIYDRCPSTWAGPTPRAPHAGGQRRCAASSRSANRRVPPNPGR